jgi:Sigma-70, region 4
MQLEQDIMDQDIKDIISEVELRLAMASVEPRWQAMVIVDDLAAKFLENSHVRLAFAKHPLLGAAFTARERGLRLDAVEEAYVDPNAASEPDDDERIRIKEVHGGLDGDLDENLDAVKKYASEAWKSESHSKRYRRRQPKVPGLVDLASKQVGKSRLIAAKPPGEAFEIALTTLTENQRAVYQDRVLANPPKTISELARELGVSRPRIVALEQRSRELMATP